MIRKISFLAFMPFIWVISLNAQTYYPMPVVKSEWKTERCFYMFSAGRYDEITIFTTGQDTVMNLTVYKKLYKKTHHWPGSAYDTTYTDVIGGMREEAKKVYMLCPSLTSPDTIERLIYDFNPTFVGDSIFVSRISYGQDTLTPHLVTAIDSVIVGGNYHRRIFLTNLVANYEQEYWVEGVGSNFGLIYASYNCITDNSYDLICFNTDDVFQFQNASPSFGYCTAPLPPAICDSVITALQQETDLNNSALIYPNPSDGHFTLLVPAGTKQIQILNSYGQTIQRRITGMQTSIAFNIENCGVYYIQFCNKNSSVTEKLIITK
jgi:hypothetical protein